MKIWKSKKRFATLLDLEPLTGEHITRKMLDFNEESGIKLKQYRGQCCDGAPNMQSQKKEVASFIL